jgi:hypothetical protein
MDTPTLQQLADLQAHVHAINQRLTDHDHRLAVLETGGSGPSERANVPPSALNPSTGSGQALEPATPQPASQADARTSPRKRANLSTDPA